MKGLYVEAKNALLRGEIDWLGGSVKLALVGPTYAPNLNTHQWLSEIPAGARVAISAPLGGKTVAGGAADASDVAFASVPSQVSAFVLFIDSGAEGTSRLLYFDGDAIPLPFNPAGDPVTVNWDNGVSKIFAV